jgi:hypothetical protein
MIHHNNQRLNVLIMKNIIQHTKKMIYKIRDQCNCNLYLIDS